MTLVIGNWRLFYYHGRQKSHTASAEKGIFLIAPKRSFNPDLTCVKRAVAFWMIRSYYVKCYEVVGESDVLPGKLYRLWSLNIKCTVILYIYLVYINQSNYQYFKFLLLADYLKIFNAFLKDWGVCNKVIISKKQMCFEIIFIFKLF